MAVTSWREGATAVNEAPTGSNSWGSVTNAKVDDGLETSAQGKNANSDTLRVSDYGFDAEIGASDTIDGIEVRIDKRQDDATGVTDNTVKLYNSGQVGDNKAETGTEWPTTLAFTTYGGASDMWGTSLTASDIRGTGFGATVRVNQGGSQIHTAFVDVIQIRVHFTAAGGLAFQPPFNRRTPTYLRM